MELIITAPCQGRKKNNHGSESTARQGKKMVAYSHHQHHPQKFPRSPLAHSLDKPAPFLGPCSSVLFSFSPARTSRSSARAVRLHRELIMLAVRHSTRNGLELVERGRELLISSNARIEVRLESSIFLHKSRVFSHEKRVL